MLKISIYNNIFENKGSKMAAVLVSMMILLVLGTTASFSDNSSTYYDILKSMDHARYLKAGRGGGGRSGGFSSYYSSRYSSESY